MKKFQVVLVIVLMLGLFFSAANVFAAAYPGADALAKPTDHPGGGKPTDAGGGKPEVTPGAKATEKAEERATEGKGKKGKKTTFKGIVASVGADSLALTLTDGSSVSFGVTAETSIKVPTLKDATLADVTAGVQALVQATQAEEGGAWTALKIHITPGKPEKVHRVGTVTAYAAGSSITIQDKDGETFTFALTADTKILPAERASELAVGRRVTIISRRDVTGGPLTAQGIVIHPEGTGPSETRTPKAPSATRTPKATSTATPTP